jgi:hypothetical protein
MSEKPEPPPKLWDALNQIVARLKNEFLLVTLAVLILVVAIGVFAPGVVQSLGAAFFYLLVGLAWLAFIIGLALNAWLELRQPPPPAARADAPPAPAQPHTPPPAFDLPNQTVHGPQTVIGQSSGPVFSGEFHGPLTVTDPSASPAPAFTPHPAEHERLYQALVAHFDQEELRTLCFKLGVEYDDLRGEGREAKARELARYVSRRAGGLDQLRAEIRAARPGAV